MTDPIFYEYASDFPIYKMGSIIRIHSLRLAKNWC